MKDRSTRTEGKVYVYAIGVDGGPHKIGTAVNVRRRLDFLQTANHCELSLVASVEADREEATLVERYAQELIIDRHRRGEWFDVSAEDAATALQEALAAVRSGERPKIKSVSRRRPYKKRKPNDGIPSAVLRMLMATLPTDAATLAKAVSRTEGTIRTAARKGRLARNLSEAVVAWFDAQGIHAYELEQGWLVLGQHSDPSKRSDRLPQDVVQANVAAHLATEAEGMAA